MKNSSMSLSILLLVFTLIATVIKCDEVVMNVVTVNEDYTVQPGDYVVMVNSTLNVVIVNLPPALGNLGRVVVVTDGACNSGSPEGHQIVARAAEGDRIMNGERDWPIGKNCYSLRLYSDGNNRWFKLGES